MTKVRGVRILKAPCCGAQYLALNYVSMNFSAFSYWTDGWRDTNLMPNDGGVRRCQCGHYLLLSDFVEIGTAEDSDLPHTIRVPAEQLPKCIAAADNPGLEAAARLGYWHHLNHPYRDLYCEHRDAEEAVTRVAWEQANPDRRTRWDKFLRRSVPVYERPADSPFTYPAFEPSEEQIHNMLRLTELLLAPDGSVPARHIFRRCPPMKTPPSTCSVRTWMTCLAWPQIVEHAGDLRLWRDLHALRIISNRSHTRPHGAFT